MDRDILPLKAFFVGFSLKRHHDQLKVAETIEDAINKCSEKNKSLRKAFYLFIKSEITRGTDLGIKNREITKLHCKETNNIDLFNTYMIIADATSFAYGKVNANGKGAIDRGYGEITIDIYQDAILSVFNRTDYDNLKHPDDRYSQFKDHNEENTYLTKKDYNFLFNISLKEILDKHFG